MRNYRFAPPREPLSTGGTQEHHRPKSIQALAVLATLVVAGSGLLNLRSLLGGPHKTSSSDWLRVLFPLDFTQNHRTVTLLLGFALILTALHLAGKKKRALHLALVMSFASGIFHLTVARDLGEAAGSFAVVAL